MKKAVLFCCCLFFGFAMMSESYLGVWEQVNKHGEKGGLVEITKTAQNTYVGTVIQIHGYSQNLVCTRCKGKFHNQPIVGLQCIFNMVDKGGKLTKGEIIDVKTGKIYHANIQYDSEKDALIVRASIDAAGRFGETQIWKRHK